MSSVGGIYGLSGSGMDIDAIVKKLMIGQQAKADALLQKKTIAQWQKAAYNTVYDDISNFRTTIFNYKLQGTLSPNKVSLSNTSVATVTANADAADVNHSLVVAQLADGVKLTSTDILSPAGSSVDRSSIAKQLYSGVSVNDISVTITNGSQSTTITVNPNGTLNDFVSQINKAGINVTASYDSTLDRFFLSTTNSGSTAAICFAGSNTSGMTFLDKLKLPVISGSNVSSSSKVQKTLAYIDPAASLGSQFSGLTNSTLKLTNSNGTTQSIYIGTGNNLLQLMGAINAGTNATASFDSTTGKFSITPTNGGTLSIDGSDQSAKDLFEQLNLPATFNAGATTTSITSVYKRDVLNPFDPTVALQSQFGEFSAFTSGQTFNLKIATGTDTPTTVTIDPTSESLNSMLAKIDAVANVDAAYDSATGKVTIKSVDGKSLDFTGSDAAGINFLVNTLKLQQTGKDAVFKLDGTPLTETSNTFSISGVTYNLTGVSTDAALLSSGAMNVNVGQATNISVTNDVDKAVDSIQSLVDSYNKILSEINGKLNEARYKDYLPLTDAQKTAMKDSDITAWNVKAQSGMLHNDTTLATLVNTMRNAFSNPVSGITGIYNSAASIGITTGSFTENGKLYLDTNKLRTALQANPNVLNQLFGASGQTITSGVTTTDTQSQGIAGRLYDTIKTTMDELKQIAGTTDTSQYETNSDYAKKITDYNTQISNEANRFQTMESAYYKKFNAMEVALEQMNSQSSWLSSQLSSIGG